MFDAGYLVFKHAGDANEAFKQLPGAQDTDSFGRAQKQLKLTSGTDKPHFLQQRQQMVRLPLLRFPQQCTEQAICACSGVCRGKMVKIRKMAAHGGLAFGKDSSQKLHDLKQEAQRKHKLQHKQPKRKKAKLQTS